jgi:hypothetical protein
MNLLLKTLLGDGELVLDDRELVDPIKTFLERNERDQMQKSMPGISDSRWDEPLAVAPLEKRQEKSFSNPLGFSKGSMGFKLKIDRIEEKISAEGERWKYGYSGDELVDARIVQE